MTAALPVSIAPRPGESIESWLENLADANGLSTAQLLATTRQAGSTRYLTLAPSPQAAARLAVLARITEQDVYAASLSRFDGTALDLTGLDPTDRHSYRHVAARGWAPAHGTQICPVCLADTGTWQSAWRLLIVTACVRHASLLVARCPACERPFRDQRHSHLRRVGAALVCGNPLGAGPLRQCEHDLTTVATTPAADAVLAMQSRVDTALADHPVTVLRREIPSPAYLTDLRHLTTLLLHLATQFGADRLGQWVTDLPAETETRYRVRGPRWGMRPPDRPAVRAGALATADAILDAADFDAASSTLMPWIALTPASPDGPLGWLADRTVMTPTLTRLVMAARAPHRRLSQHLDTQPPDGVRMPINLVVIPQVIPHAQYVEHLDGAFDSGEDTVRLFASLSLARLHPDVTSWAAAAKVLAMPGTMGVRCGRACSATMRVTADEWEARIWRAIEAVPRRDYRATEAQVADRRLKWRWFDAWARAARPRTRDESHGYALTWLWINCAHGHLNTSPAWSGRRPVAFERTGYRQFAASINEEQQSELRLALINLT